MQLCCNKGGHAKCVPSHPSVNSALVPPAPHLSVLTQASPRQAHALLLGGGTTVLLDEGGAGHQAAKGWHALALALALASILARILDLALTRRDDWWPCQGCRGEG